MKLPSGVYLVNKSLEDLAQLPSEAEHICIDAEPEAELILRLTLARYSLYPDIAPKIFGYRYMQDNQSAIYYFLNEEQHNSLENKDAPCSSK